MNRETTELLRIKNLSLSFYTRQEEMQALKEISLSLKKGEILAIVGESGCGKSVLCRSIVKLLPQTARVKSGNILVNGTDITDYSERQMQKLRGRIVSMVFQDPLSSLNPTMPVGVQIAEAVAVHNPKMNKTEIYRQAIELMALVQIENPAERYWLYPCHFSGGMRQRCAIAIGLAAKPQILLADEPTTALDVTIQAQILDLLCSIQKELGMGILLVSHDLRVVAKAAGRVAVMNKGKIVETGTVEKIFYEPEHPYTKGLVRDLFSLEKPREGLCSVPKMRKDLNKASPDKSPEEEVVLEARHLIQRFKLGKKETVQAVDDISFQIRRGEVFGLVGESGSGKSTIARCVMNICRPAAGTILYQGIDIWAKGISRSRRKDLLARRQMIFQDSASSLNPRMKVVDIITEPMQVSRKKTLRGSYRAEAEFQMKCVGLDVSYLDAYPPCLSGGQRQRVAIARALTMEPELLVADEPAASLDISTQAQIIQLFKHLQKEHKFTFLFIAHDLSVVRCLCDRVGVMYRGKLVETAPCEELFKFPRHPYTKALLASEPAFSV